jgi:dihydroorotase
VEVLQGERSRSQGISAEVTPHNLLLTETDLEKQGPFATMVPPLRKPSDVESLWGALLDGTIDIVATDHAPHLPAEKEPGREDIWNAPCGIPGLQTFLPLMLNQVSKGVMTLSELIGTCSERPARLFGLYPRKGTLLPGSDADLVIVDPDREKAVENAEQLSKAAVTPFAGHVLRGWPVLTMVRGRVVMRDGKITGVPSGIFVKPQKRD